MRSSKIGMTNVPSDLDPLKARYAYDLMMNACVFSRLVQLDGNGQVVSELASSWKVSDAGDEYTFTLNSDARFHDGSPVTARDVVYTFERILKSDRPPASILRLALDPSFRSDEDCPVKAVNDRQVKFHLPGAYPPFLSLLCNPVFGIVAQDSDGKIGSGPMVLEADEHSKTLKFKPFQEGAGLGEFYVKQISRDSLPEVIAEDELDLIFGLNSIDFQNVIRIDPYKVVRGHDSFVAHFLCNTKSPVLDSLERRRNLSYLINSLSDEVSNLAEYQKPLKSFLPSGLLSPSYYQRATSPVSEDAFSAKNSQFKAQPLRIVVQKGIFSQSYMSALGSLIERLGMVPDIQLVDSDALWNRYAKDDYDLISFSYSLAIPDDPDGYLWPFDNKELGIDNRFPMSSFLQKIEKVRFTSNQKERLELYEREFKQFEQEHYFIPVLQHDHLIAFKNRSEIPTLKPTFLYRLSDFIRP